MMLRLKTLDPFGAPMKDADTGLMHTVSSSVVLVPEEQVLFAVKQVREDMVQVLRDYDWDVVGEPHSESHRAGFLFAIELLEAALRGEEKP